jgi:hypothetical protein
MLLLRVCAQHVQFFPIRRIRYYILWSACRKFGGGTWQHWYRRPLECYTSGPRDKNLLTWLITSCFSHPLTILWTRGSIRVTFSFNRNFDLVLYNVLYISANSQKVQNVARYIKQPKESAVFPLVTVTFKLSLANYTLQLETGFLLTVFIFRAACGLSS